MTEHNTRIEGSDIAFMLLAKCSCGWQELANYDDAAYFLCALHKKEAMAAKDEQITQLKIELADATLDYYRVRASALAGSLADHMDLLTAIRNDIEKLVVKIGALQKGT